MENSLLALNFQKHLIAGILYEAIEATLAEEFPTDLLSHLALALVRKDVSKTIIDYVLSYWQLSLKDFPQEDIELSIDQYNGYLDEIISDVQGNPNLPISAIDEALDAVLSRRDIRLNQVVGLLSNPSATEVQLTKWYEKTRNKTQQGFYRKHVLSYIKENPVCSNSLYQYLSKLP